MRFDAGVVREIHARVDLAEFVGSYVSLHKRGNDLVGLCPFHAEKTPSFHVHPDKGFFKCFGCGAGGDVITFAQRIENVAFPDAVRMLAQRAGVALETEDPRAARSRTEREAIYQCNALAASFFERMLAHPKGAPAREYCARRGISAASLERFHIGYAPDDWNALAAELQRNGVEPALAELAGLLKRGERDYYDFYRNRLMIPTYALTGEVTAFGGRALGDAEPKYLNTATTPVYTKGRHLFALNIARRATAQDRTLIVVEGYLDCIALHQAGFDNAVASLGTAFTQEQAKELGKYADGVYLCFDGDAAGSAAAAKAIEAAAGAVEHAGTSVRIVLLPANADPDSFIRSEGAAAFRALLDAAKPAIEFRLEGEVRRLQSGFVSPAAVAREAEAVIRRMTPVQEWDRWRVWIAKRLGVSENDLRNSRFLANATNFGPRTLQASSPTRYTGLRVKPSSFEREVLAMFVEEPELVHEFSGAIPASRFRDPVYRRIYARMTGSAAELRQTSDVFGLFVEDEEATAALASLGRRDRSSTLPYAQTADRRTHLERVVEHLQREDEELRYRELSGQIDELLGAGQSIGSELRDEFDTLVAKLKK